ncbi:MAG: ThuA domain-containing protein [Kiritimatiellae bacterium]|nr:ThuA domain-containing protein [Kiritimatiellia bacterium]MDD5521581.1 ThuA domain-containing protein [Kiritimatiellia bacterium]
MKLTNSLSFIISIMAVTVLAAESPAPQLSTDNAPAGFPVVPPKGRIILWGADAAKAGKPITYQISYLADDAIAGKSLQMAVKCAIQVEQEQKNNKTGKMEKKKVDKFSFKFLPITPKKQSVEIIKLPEFDKEHQIELYFVDKVENPQSLSNSLKLKKKGDSFMMPEAEEIAKVAEVLPVKATEQPAKPRKVLVYTMTLGFPHDSIPLGARTILLIGQKTGAWQTLISNDRYMFEPETLAQFDAVMMMETTGPLFGDPDKTVNERLRKSLLDFVENGKGIAGSHAATDCAYDWKEYGAMMGGYFAGHPFYKIKVRNEDPKNPINAAFKGEGFDFLDEMYTFRDPYSRENLRILLSIDISTLPDDPGKPGFKKGENRQDHDYAISWIREKGKGRVFYCSFGHQHPVWWTSTILQHYLDGMQYALGDLKADATPSAKK